MDRELRRNMSLSVAYVGSAGRRLPSSIDPINAINPSYLSMGDRLNDQFKPGMTSLNGVPLPYAGWVEQMTGCAPSVAQALRPYPQYCDNLQGLNENIGSSHYNSLQVKLEKRFSGGYYALVSYTLSKTISSASDNTQRDALTWSGVQGVISPFEKERNEVIAVNDSPHVLSAAFVYELPVGQGKKYMDQGGVTNALLGGWQASTIFRYSSGFPIFFRVQGTSCNVPGAFRAGCIPGIVNPDAVFAQDKGSFDPGKGPLFNKDAFEPLSAFNFYFGSGNRIEESVRGFGYHNQDLSFIKNTRMAGNTNFQFRFEIFNLWNWHMFIRPVLPITARGVQHRPCEPGLRQVERHGHRPAHDAARRAVRVLARMRALHRAAWAAVFLLSMPIGAGAQDLSPALAKQFTEGVAALAAGELDSAEAAFRAVIRDGGDRAFVRHNLGIVLQQRGRHADALVEFRAANRLDPSFGPSRLLAGTSLLALGQPKSAVAELGRAVCVDAA